VSRRGRTDTVPCLLLQTEGAGHLLVSCPPPEPLRQPLDRDAGIARSRTTTVRMQPLKVEV
jgi:hypothetical protein